MPRKFCPERKYVVVKITNPGMKFAAKLQSRTYTRHFSFPSASFPYGAGLQSCTAKFITAIRNPAMTNPMWTQNRNVLSWTPVIGLGGMIVVFG